MRVRERVAVRDTDQDCLGAGRDVDDVAIAALYENLFQLSSFQLADGAGAGGQCGRTHGGDAVLVRASCEGRCDGQAIEGDEKCSLEVRGESDEPL